MIFRASQFLQLSTLEQFRGRLRNVMAVKAGFGTSYSSMGDAMYTVLLMIVSFAAGFLIRAKGWPDKAMTISDYKKKPYS